MDSLPVLYSFRRCPYAIRARHAIAASGQRVRLREVVLRDKPACMLRYSPKATVPVLLLPSGTIIDESLEIMEWALDQSDPENWLSPRTTRADELEALVSRNDGYFKHHLDRYKYATRYEGADAKHHREAAEIFLAELNDRLARHAFLFSEQPSFADAAILPFMRQFANTDRSWFDATPYPHLRRWLAAYLASEAFRALMPKFPQWHEGDVEPVFP